MIPDNPNNDPNWVEYQRLLKSNVWHSQYRGTYVCFVGGNLVDSDSDKKSLLGRVRKLYADQPRTITLVDRNREGIDIPSDMTVKDK